MNMCASRAPWRSGFGRRQPGAPPPPPPASARAGGAPGAAAAWLGRIPTFFFTENGRLQLRPPPVP
jgi:hypothetical protein